MATRQLTRSSSNRIVAGVASGIAAYTGWDLGLVRIITAILMVIFPGAGLLVYVLLWIILPDERSSTTGMDQILTTLKNKSNRSDTQGDDPHPGDYR